MTKKRTPLTELAAEAKADAPAKPAPAEKPSAKSNGKAESKPARKPRTAKPAAANATSTKAAPGWTPNAKPKPLRDLDPSNLSAMNLRMPKEMHKRLQFQRIEEGRPMNDVIVEAIHNYLRKASGPAR